MNRLDEAIAATERVVLAAPQDNQLKLQLALYYQMDKQNQKAIDLYTKVLENDPANAAILRSRGDAYLTMGNHAAAIADFDQALTKIPDDPTVLNNLAWVLATSPEDELRDGKRAVELATRACEVTEYAQAHILSTLAAAFAESGDFDTAVEWSEKAVELDSDEQPQLEKELASYKGKQPWRERQSAEELEDSVEKDVAP